MARAKKAPLRNAPEAPERFQAVINFHRSCNTEIIINMEAHTAVITVKDLITGKTYTAEAELQEEA